MTFSKKINNFRRSALMALTRGVGRRGGHFPCGDKGPAAHRVLLSRPNGRLGNMLLMTPLVEEVCARFPECRIDLFVKGGVAHAVFENYPQVDRIIKLPKEPFKHLFKYLGVWISLRKVRYDLVINAIPGSSSGRLSTALARGRFKSFDGPEQELRARYPDYGHIAKGPVYNFRDFTACPGDPPQGPVPPLDLRLSEAERVRGRALLKEILGNDRPTIAIYTFATGDKCYSPDWWGEMYRNLTGRYGERYNILEVLPVENVSQIDFAAPGYYSRDIREMAAVMAATRAVLLADSGIMHLASAAPVPVAGLFSVTPIEGYRPYNRGSIAIDTNTTGIDRIVEAFDALVRAGE